MSDSFWLLFPVRLVMWLSSLSAGDWWAYGSAFIVLLGVVGEAICDLTKWIRSKTLNEKIKVASTLVLILGLAGDLVSIHVTRIEEASLIREAGDAKKSADNASHDAVVAKGAADDAKKAAVGAVDLATTANREANFALGSVRQASNQLAQLRTDAQNLETEANKTKSDLIDLAVCNAPRVITNWAFSGGGKPGQTYVDPLLPMAGQIVFVEVIADAEARRAALNIVRTLLDAKWDVQKPPRTVGWLEDGVSVQPSAPPLPIPTAKGHIPDMSAYRHADDVAEKLIVFLHSYNWQATKGWPIDAQGKLIRDPKILPPGAIRIQVGLYPPVVYVSPPGQQELNARLQEVKEQQNKLDAERERKWEEHLKTLPLEVQKRVEEAHREWEAKIKNAMSKGPCQILNPLF